MTDIENIEIAEDERLCAKCNKIVNKKNFNAYFGICHDCEDNSGH